MISFREVKAVAVEGMKGGCVEGCVKGGEAHDLGYF